MPPVLHSSKHSPQLDVHHELVGFPGSIIIALPAAVYFDLVQKSGGFGSLPQPHAPLVRSLYQVVEAHGFPLNIGGQPSQYDNFGASGCWQEESARAVVMTVNVKIMAVFIMTTKRSYCQFNLHKLIGDKITNRTSTIIEKRLRLRGLSSINSWGCEH